MGVTWKKLRKIFTNVQKILKNIRWFCITEGIEGNKIKSIYQGGL